MKETRILIEPSRGSTPKSFPPGSFPNKKKKVNKVISKLIETNNKDYQLLKVIEELSELQTALLQYINKEGKKTTKQDVIDEIGDVKIRIKILTEIFGKEEVKKRIKEKVNKFDNYLKNGKYIGNI